VIGIGIIELRVQTSPNSSNTTVMALHNVLHTSDAIFNGLKWRTKDLEVNEHSTSFTRDWVQAKDQPTGRGIWRGTNFCGLNKLALVDDPEGESKLPEPFGDLKREKPLALMLSLCSTEGEIKNLFSPSGVYTGLASSNSSYDGGWTVLALHLEGNPFLEHFLRRRKGS
jgi:hypothetical protein